MTTLRRTSDTFHLPPLLWEALQKFAMREGWQPAGAIDIDTGESYSGYRAGLIVRKRDAEAMAAALVRVVNSRMADDGALDLPAVVGMVNFLRGGAFEIL